MDIVDIISIHVSTKTVASYRVLTGLFPRIEL